MKLRKIDKRMVDAILDPETTKDHLLFFEERLRDKLTQLESKSTRNTYMFIIASFAWFVIKSASIRKMSILGMEFVEFELPILILPLIAAFSYYRYLCTFTFSALIDMILRRYYAQILKPFWERNLTEFLSPLTFLDIEQALVNLEDYPIFATKVARVWSVTFGIATLLIPAIILLYMSYSILASPSFGIACSLGSSLFIIVLVIRSFLLYYQQYSELKELDISNSIQ